MRTAGGIGVFVAAAVSVLLDGAARGQVAEPVVTTLMMDPPVVAAVPGQSIQLTYRWQGGPTLQSWKVFVHITSLDESTIYVGDDHTPTPDTTRWFGQTITDVSPNHPVVSIPANLPPGEYKILVGLYRPGEGSRKALQMGPGVTAGTTQAYRYQVGTLTTRLMALAMDPPVISAPVKRPVNLTYRWQGGLKTTDRVFVHILDPSTNTIVFQDDHDPPPDPSRPGYALDQYTRSVNVPSGEYILATGLTTRAQLAMGPGVIDIGQARYQVARVTAAPVIRAATVPPAFPPLPHDQPFSLSLNFRGGPFTPPAGSGPWQVFVHFHDASGTLAFQGSAPVQDFSTWAYDQSVAVTARPPANAAAGTYTVVAGLYAGSQRMILAPAIGEGVTDAGSRSYAVGQITIRGPLDVSVADFGAAGDDTDATAAFYSAFAAVGTANAAIYVPKGLYRLNNASGAFAIHQFNGRLVFGDGAVVRFTDNTQPGFYFGGGNGSRFENVRYDFVVPPPQRISPNEGFKIDATTSAQVTNLTVDNSVAAGLLFYHCTNPVVDHVVVNHSLADGVHFANCKNVNVSNVYTFDTGDDGLAFLRYDGENDQTNVGGYAHNIFVRNSYGRGITNIGQIGVTIDNFYVDGSRVSGILCARDSNYKTGSPDTSAFLGGTVLGGGTLPARPGDNPANTFGVEIESARECDFTNVLIQSPATRGLTSHNDTLVKLTGVQIAGAPTDGFSSMNDGRIEITNGQVAGVGGYGAYFNGDQSIAIDGLSLSDTSIGTNQGNLHRPFWIDQSQTVSASGIQISSSDTTTTWIIGAAGGDQCALTGTVAYSSTLSNLTVQNLCKPGVQFIKQ